MWKKWLAGLVIGIVLTCCLGLAWFNWQYRDYEPFTARVYYPSYPTESELDLIEGNGDVILPPSAREIYGYVTGFNELFVKARFSIDPNELDLTLENSLCDGELKEVKVASPSPESDQYDDGTSEWWTLHKAEILTGCQGVSESSYQRVWVDMTNPDEYIVFIMNSVG